MTRGFYAVGCSLYWVIRDLTPGEGPIEVGVDHNDLSVGESAEALDAEVVSPSNIIERERASRPVRRSGVFFGLAESEVLNNGKPIRTKMMFSLDPGFNARAWARNKSGAALTTGAIITVTGKMWGRWT